MSQPVFVFVASNWLGQMYVGLTRNVHVAMRQLKERSVIPTGLSAGVDKLLFFREFSDPVEAKRFESTLQHLSRKTLLQLARNVNPFLTDLSSDWYLELNGDLCERQDPAALRGLPEYFPSGGSDPGTLN